MGGAGFIGRHLIARLSAESAGRSIVVPTRRRVRARHLLPLPTVEVVEANIHDDADLAELIGRCDAVINLVGILHSRTGTPYGPDFARAHVALPRRIGAACAKAGVPRVIHVSALGVTDHEQPLASQYLRSKADGERALRQTDGLALTILRPSVVFGPDDRFLNLFARLQRFAPIMPLARAAARLQPVYVADVAHAICGALESSASVGHAYELAGPEVFALADLVRISGRLSGYPRPVIALPDWIGWLQAAALEFAPGPTLMSRDNFASLAVDNVATPGARGWGADLGIEAPTPLMAVLPKWLHAGSHGYDRMRAQARRG